MRTMWNDVIGQERVLDALQRTLARDRVAHAYLFYGPDGAGKRAVALALAQALLCEHPDAAPDGTCNACRKVQRMLHPDVHFLMPQPTDATTDDVAARLQHLATEPYAAIDFVRRPSLNDPSKTSNKQAFYSVARMNAEVRRTMSFKPVEGRYKIAIITDADLLRTEAANAFLKLLEEPAPRTVFILTTARPDRLLPTIVSRCQRLRFDLLTAEAISEALVAREGVAPEHAEMLARMADGSYSRALDLRQNDALLESRALVLDYFRLAYAQNIDKLADQIERIKRLGREQVKSVLNLMLSWIRDLLLFRVMGPAAPLVNVDQRQAIERFCTHVPDADLEGMVRLVEEAMDLVERNVHLNLVLTALAQALGRAMRFGQAPKLYQPLVEELHVMP